MSPTRRSRQSHMDDGAGGGGGDPGLAGSGVVASTAGAGTGALAAGGCGGMAGTADGATSGDAVAACTGPADRIIENPRKARTRPTITMPHKRK